MRHTILIGALLMTAATLACALPGSAREPEATASPSVEAVTPTAPPPTVTPSPTIPPDPDLFVAQLQQALNAEDYPALEALMGDAFSIGYWLSEGGLISTGDAINLLRNDLLSGPEPITFEPSIDPSTVINDDITRYAPNLQRAIFSTGWGASGTDEAILFIAADASGALFWEGLLYARDGFGVQITGETTNIESTPTSAPPPSPSNPIFGELIYEHNMLSGWLTISVTNGSMGHVPEGYQFKVVEQALWTYSTRVKQSEFYAELEATPSACPIGQGNYGLLFHYQDDTHYRVFVVWCSGLYSLFERSEANRVFTLSKGNLPAGIDPTTGTHTLAVHAKANVLTLYLDNYLVASSGVSQMPVGDVGPYAETTGGHPMIVTFSHIAVFEP